MRPPRLGRPRATWRLAPRRACARARLVVGTDMAHGTPTVASATSGAARLRPSYELVGPEELVVLSAAPSVHDPHMVQYGYHDGSEQRLPPHLVRYIEPTEAEFDRQVEYDMDEQGTPPHADPDQAWLAQVNAERKQNQLDVVTCEAFEIIVDRLEKEWFALVKRIPSRFSIGARDDDDEFPDDSLCAICDDNECENLNAIVFCDGCNLAVHQDCYGIPYIPEGQWLCRKCTVSPDRPVSCVLCPNEGGAFKQTTQGTWAHLLCAMWIPETGVGNAVYMEPIDGISAIPKARWRLRCYLCNKRSGACIQCEHRSCFTAFHVMCARRVGLLSKARRSRGDEGDEGDDAPLVAYCHHHLPPDEKAELRAKVRGADAADDASDSDVSTRELALPKPSAHTAGESIALKSARAYNKLYSAGPLPVPNYLVNRVLEYVARIPLRRKPQTVAQIVRYWSLKRQEMRGAPLLKRLHIEPWTVGNFVDERTSALKLAKLQYLYRLREDLEKVRLLAELVRKREKAKLRQARLFQTHAVQGAMLYRQTAMRHALERLMAFDKANWFLQPVSTEDAPDYYERIAEPMDWSTIASRIASLTYTTAAAMESDARLVCANALAYNTPDSAIAKTAAKIAKACDAIFAPVHAAFADAGELGVEPSDAVVALLASRPEPPAPKSVAIGDANADSIVDAYLRQFYYVRPPDAADDEAADAKAADEAAGAAPRPAKAPRKKPPPRTPPAAPRRSGRHAAPETPSAPAAPAEPPAEPRVLEDMDQKDSFTYFNTGWLLPPGARRNNRPRPPPPPEKKSKRSRASQPGRRVRRAPAAPRPVESDDDSSLSELSTESA